MDEGGLLPEDLDEVMSTWEVSQQGPKRGFSVLYGVVNLCSYLYPLYSAHDLPHPNRPEPNWCMHEFRAIRQDLCSCSEARPDHVSHLIE